MSCQIFLSFGTSLLLLRINNNANKISFWTIFLEIKFRCIISIVVSLLLPILKFLISTSFKLEGQKSLLKRNHMESEDF
ncbi:unnamed protein product [Callosobruchus maculatus]|uniref:Uncharacterized protein n=1 Tax=Callosobruchus maculatus TaxID=64391 RepID=A0A653D6D0_CALMS|nr:unnamed protein product [Callosobruchus maculatus]